LYFGVIHTKRNLKRYTVLVVKLTLMAVLYGTGHRAAHKTTQFSLSRQAPLPSESEFSLWDIIALLEVLREKVVAGQFITVLVESELHGTLTTP